MKTVKLLQSHLIEHKNDDGEIVNAKNDPGAILSLPDDEADALIAARKAEEYFPPSTHSISELDESTGPAAASEAVGKFETNLGRRLPGQF
jgi:hypothetical protein